MSIPPEPLRQDMQRMFKEMETMHFENIRESYYEVVIGLNELANNLAEVLAQEKDVSVKQKRWEFIRILERELELVEEAQAWMDTSYFGAVL